MSYGKKLFLKVILAGEAAVGKTSLRRSYIGESFITNHLETIGADFASMPKEIKDLSVLFQIWDIAGQDVFEKVRMMYYRGSMGALMVFDATKTSTLKSLDGWIKELEEGSERGIVPFSILGNKMDLITKAKREKLRIQVKKYVTALNKKYSSKGFKVEYFETSAKTGENVHSAFENLGSKIIDYILLRKEKRGKTS
ncbi:MAG: GTP-binding protein [Candidatus Heimdallarchaeota archaeon]|nr:GTP-binding protein [Candidatus Heimdallarchaeota archaeon]MCK4955854.1 GTP-binding protein [Candidatus Heimdallarchaeota archaeon]